MFPVHWWEFTWKSPIMNSSAKQCVMWIQSDWGLVLALPLMGSVPWVRDLSSPGLSALIWITEDYKDYKDYNKRQNSQSWHRVAIQQMLANYFL